MTVIQTLRTAINNRARYNRTVHEIRTMPLDVALDLDIHRADARQIAARAVYGA